MVAVGDAGHPTPTSRKIRIGICRRFVGLATNYIDWAARQEVFESMAAVAGAMFALREPGSEAEELRGQRVTAKFFDALRAGPG